MRVIKVQEDGFTTVYNNIITCPELSAKAKGIYLYLFSKPNNWKFSSRRISKDFKDGVDSIQSGLRELEEIGLLERRNLPPVKDPKTKKFVKDVEYLIYTDFQKRENPAAGKSSHIIIKSINNKEYKGASIFNAFKEFHDSRFSCGLKTPGNLYDLEERLSHKSKSEIEVKIRSFFENNPTIVKDYEVFVKWALRD